MASSVWGDLIFNYLNNNKHKFDQQGKFDPTPDERDFIPFGAVTYSNGGWGGRPRTNNPKINKPKYAGKYREGQGPDDLAKEHMEYHARDYKNGIRYDEEKCIAIKDFEDGLCHDGYQGRALQACLARVSDRHDICKKDHHFNNAPKMWTAEDMTGQPVGDEDLDKRRKKSGSNAQPNPEPEKKPDKSEFSLDSVFWNSPMGLYVTGLALATHPEAMQPTMNRVLRNFVMMPSDYPEQMRPSSPWVPQPFHHTWMNAMPMPLSSGAGLGVAPPVPR